MDIRLREVDQLLRWHTAIAGCSMLVFSCMAWWVPRMGIPEILVGVTLLTLLMVGPAWLALRTQRPDAAVGCLVGGYLFNAIGAVFLIPEIYPVIMLVPIISVVTTLPYLRGQAFVRVLWVSIATLLLVTGLGTLDTNILTLPPTPPPLVGWIVVIGTALECALIGVLLWQYKWRLHRTQDALLAANNDLKGANEDLERHVTARTVALQEALTAAQDAMRAKMAFLATMSHELRTPLNGILGFSSLVTYDINDAAEGNWRDVPVDRIQDYLGRITRNGQTLLQLINDVLDMAKIDAGKMELRMADVDLVALCTEVIHDLAVSARADVPLVWTPPEDSIVVWGDQARLRQILMNLLSNAIKFTSVGTITVDVGTHDGTAWLTVTDTGEGIAPEHQARIFESFEQARTHEDVLRREHGGTGLGLPISRKLTELHRGTLTVTSSLGRGSTFRMAVPLTIVEANTPLVAIVDDDPDNTLFLQTQLTPLGVSALVIHNPQDAIGQIVRHPTIRLVLLDLEMPLVHGWALLEQLRGDARTADIPVVICSADPGAKQVYLLRGAIDVLLKPVTPTAVQQLIQRRLPMQTGRVPTVLIVDDTEDARMIIRMVLLQMGYHTLEASNGFEAMALLQQHGTMLSMIVLDLMMPGMSGLEVLHELRTTLGLSALPVVVVSAKTLTAEEEDCLRQQRAALLPKHAVTPAALLNLIEGARREPAPVMSEPCA